MPISHRIENHNDSEVLIVNVPRYFSSEELESKLDTAAKRSYQRGSTFKVVIDYDYTLKHIASTGFLYDELKILEQIPDKGFEYRVSIVVDNDPTITKALTADLFDRPLDSITDFIGRAVKVGLLVLDAAVNIQLHRSSSLTNNSWVRIHTSLDEGIDWCVSSSPWA